MFKRNLLILARNMRNVRWLGAAMMCLFLFAPAAHSQADYSGLMHLVSPAVVLIETPGSGSGTGFVLNYQLSNGDDALALVTACHVVNGAPKIALAPGSYPVVRANFKAWMPDVVMEAAVVSCDPSIDTAVLVPIDDKGQLTSLSKYLKDLAEQRNDPRLRQTPSLWLADEDYEVNPLSAAFFLGYPGPFSEFSVNVGRVSAQLPVSFIQADDGWIGSASRLIVYQGENDETITQNNLVSIDFSVTSDMETLTNRARAFLLAGYQIVLFANGLSPLDVRAWGITDEGEEGLALFERPLTPLTIIGFELVILPQTDLQAKLAFQREFLKVDGSVGPGYSGGPVLNQFGQVVGMVQWEVSGLEGANYAGLAKDIFKTLND